MCLDLASILLRKMDSLELVYLHLLFDSPFCPLQNPGLYTNKPGGKNKYSSQYSLPYTCISPVCIVIQSVMKKANNTSYHFLGRSSS